MGGGREATKKAMKFLRYGASVTIYSLQFSDKLLEIAEGNDKVKLLRGDVRRIDFISKLIDKYDIVVYTVPDMDDIERWVKLTCKKLRKIYILSTNAKETGAALPIETTIHGYVITVFSGGKSSLASKYTANEIKKYLETRLDLKLMLETMGYVKRYLKEKRVNYKDRMKLYHIIFNDRLYRCAIQKRDREEAYSRIHQLVDKYLSW